MLKKIELKTIGEINLTPKVKEYIDCLHEKVGTTEWSGILFYKLISGDIKQMKDLVFQSDFIYPRDIGDSTHTSTTAGGDIMDAYDIYPEGIECSTGLVHSHHSMSTFFSGTDTKELEDNAFLYNYYVSLIVNFDGKYCCKIAIPGKMEGVAKITLKDTDGNPYTVETVEDHDVLFVGDLTVKYDSVRNCEEWLDLKIKELQEKKAKSLAKIFPRTSNPIGFGQQLAFDDDYHWRPGQQWDEEMVNKYNSYQPESIPYDKIREMEDAQEAKQQTNGSFKRFSNTQQFILMLLGFNGDGITGNASFNKLVVEALNSVSGKKNQKMAEMSIDLICDEFWGSFECLFGDSKTIGDAEIDKILLECVKLLKPFEKQFNGEYFFDTFVGLIQNEISISII